MKNLRLILILLGLAFIAIIVVQNTDEVETRLLFARITMPRAVLLFVTFAVGFVVGALVTLRMKKQQRKAAAAKA